MPRSYLLIQNLFQLKAIGKYTPVLVLCMLLFSCKKEKEKMMPVISQITPASAYIGDTVTVSGRFFESYPADNFVSFNGSMAVQYISGNDSQVRVVIPYGATAGNVVLDASGRTSEGFPYQILSRNVSIASISPNASDAAPVGSTVEITGTGFVPANYLSGQAFVTFFEGLKAPIVSATSTVLKVKVPTGVKTGSISLFQEGFTILGPVFSVISPIISSITPAEAFEGMKITLNGANLKDITEVTINGRPAIIGVKTATSLEIEVPAGTGTGTFPVIVTFRSNKIESEAKCTVKPLTGIARTIYYLNGNTPYRNSLTATNTSYNARLAQAGAICLENDPATGNVYYGYNNTLYSSNADGTNFKKLFEGSSVSVGYPADLTVANGKIYWTDGNNNLIKQGNADGTGSIQILYGNRTPLNGIFGISVQGNTLYWTDYADKTLMKGTIDGTATPTAVTLTGTELVFPQDIDVALIEGKVYAYIVDIPQNEGSEDPDVILWGELTASGLNLEAIPSTQGSIIGTSYLFVDSAQKKIAWGSNASRPNKLIQSLFNGTGTTTLTTHTSPFTSFFIVE